MKCQKLLPTTTVGLVTTSIKRKLCHVEERAGSVYCWPHYAAVLDDKRLSDEPLIGRWDPDTPPDPDRIKVELKLGSREPRYRFVGSSTIDATANRPN